MIASSRAARLVAAVAGAGLLVSLGVARAGVPLPASTGRLAPASVAAMPRLLSPKVTHVPDAWEMLGVSCVSQKSCVAVGYAASTAPKGLDGGILVPITNGRAGKPVHSSDSTSIFYGVSCITAKKCVVVGQSTPPVKPAVGRRITPPAEPEATAWMWQGGKLTLITELGDANNETSSFRDVVCQGKADCLLVGDATHPFHGVTGQPFAEYGVVYLKGRPTLEAVDNNATMGYAASITCPSSRFCLIGGATASEAGVEGMLTLPNLHKLKTAALSGAVQSPVSGLQGIACISAHSCEAAEVQDLPMSGQYQGWVEHLNGSLTGTPHELTSPAVATQMFKVAAINSSSYLAVGYAGVNWLTDLVSASGHAGPDSATNRQGYLEDVTCPVQTMCIAVGFAADSNPKQPGGLDGVDGAIAVFPLKTPPSAPAVTVVSMAKTSAKVRIKAPSSDGDVAITSYHLAVTRCAAHHKGCKQQPVKTMKVAVSKSIVDVGGLSRKTTYFFAATATNAIGTGPFSRQVHKKTK